MSRRKKTGIIALVILVVLAAAAGIISACLPNYEIRDTVSSFDFPISDEVEVEITADRKGGRIRLQNNADHHVAEDLDQFPMDVEILLEDGWHELLPSTRWFRGTDIIAKGSTCDIDFEWEDVLGGNLRPGSYRAILYMWKTNGAQDDGFYLVEEFQIS